MKTSLLGLIIFNIAAIYYLVLPLPRILDLPQSIKSTEPGDTTQMARVAGYFTNLNRAQVIGFYSANFHPPFSFWLNYPPEKAKEIFRDTMQSYYLQEIVIPFKGSLFVNGYEWENDVFTKPDKRAKNKLLVDGVEFKSKVTTRYFFPSLPNRLASFLVTEFSIIATIYVFKKAFFK